MNKGYSLLELLIAMTITLLATLSITKFFITEHHIYMVQEAEAEMNQTLRGALDLLTRELILAGYGLPSTSKKITLFNKDEIEFRTNLRNIISFLSTSASPGQNILYIKDGGQSFAMNDVIIICNAMNHSECEGHTLSEDGKNNSLTLTSGLGSTLPAGSRIDLINTIAYRYNGSKKELQRKIDRGYWEAVSENIAKDGFIVSYRDRNNNSPLDSSEIYRIDINLMVESFRRDAFFQDNNGYRRASAKATVILRN